MIPIAKPSITTEEIEAVSEVLLSGNIAQSKKVDEFEKQFSDYIGSDYAVSTSNGTTALHVALLSNGIGKGHEVITTSFTFVATANSVLFTGAKPVFVDIDPNSFNIDPCLLEEKITKKTKAIMPVHLYGQPANIKEINEICQDHNLILIEDAAQAHGAKYNGKKIGSFGTGCFSFYPTKNMTTSEGGMITTNNKLLYEKAKKIRNHGQEKRYYYDTLGFNFRMTDICAAIGICQLRKLEEFNKTRRKNAEFYSKRLSKLDYLECPKIFPKKEHVFHQYTLRIKNGRREEIIKGLEKAGIGYGIYYPKPLHKQPLYIELGYKDKLKETEKAAEEVISIPVHPSLKKEELEYIVSFFEGLK
ncbi:MAG: Aspartate aminotransferase [Candidatus Methanofastidiosum methylothiophilum]|uniref:Aspartate aminotransferase n=1 Tax=Candidatus Methanofastidiosum methylothiophilum TaxID=1705564 RepID=A0A150IJI2_9EURY|nr:MAG: Aspartate aminotransferase [Candidatus Methanofastidiosum methylthiophilus]KYC47422.1 MAG: Aspartate aminotransferase [Candidatus Methanofastidiosum methylthiophilus]KYC49606.1 MAG: Aspartate aminotransferase [Candidatus Methanofastidiosum methylthiophilus]